MLCLGSYCGCEGPVRPLHRRNTRKNWESQIWDGGRNLWGSICENDPIGWMYRISRDLCWLDRDDMAGTWYVSHYWWGWAQLVNTTQPASCRKQGRGRGESIPWSTGGQAAGLTAHTSPGCCPSAGWPLLTPRVRLWVRPVSPGGEQQHNSSHTSPAAASSQQLSR